MNRTKTKQSQPQQPTVADLADTISLAVRVSDYKNPGDAYVAASVLSTTHENREVVLLRDGQEDTVFMNGAALSFGMLSNNSRTPAAEKEVSTHAG